MHICERCEEVYSVIEGEVLGYNEEIYADDGEHIACVLHRVCLTPKAVEENQRHNLFRTRGTVKGKVLNIIIDNGSTDNLISFKAVTALGLPMSKHSHLYQLGWIRNGKVAKVLNTCLVSLSIGKSYSDQVVCDVVDMDATNLILGRPCQYDQEAVY